ncbi:hypothetical protein [Afipia sp. Root123D2]|uniref:hypothetical protein n=1 Tax=Afipia sp. Root123D2 TaxID=1736436 RepID=UPI001AEC3095|nr:hypothetical protein [Afipia sp. Root123D2]
MLDELCKSHLTIRNAVYTTSQQLQPLKSLQKLLIKEITRAERKIRRSKSILRTCDTAQAQEASTALQERIEQYRHLAYTWRCFGDAIAFLFMDKFALKQTLFNTHNVNAKQDAGFIADKEGLSKEWSIMENLLDKGIPALLTDITNTIRHGDVCIMIGPDPHLIEIKSGKFDGRGRRQRNSIRELLNFFETDEAEGLRGFEKIRRITHDTSEVVYVDAMNDCIREAMRSGTAWRSPEEGLYYVAITAGDVSIENILVELGVTQPMAFSLNEVKARRAWSPYSPFTLSIRNCRALFGFIWGEIYIAVFYEPDALQRLAECRGYKLEFQPSESEIAFELTRLGDGRQIRVASQMFFRLAFDFTSPAWILCVAIENLNRHEIMV